MPGLTTPALPTGNGRGWEMKRVAGLSALTGSGVGLVVMAGYAARIALAISKRHGWGQAREFLGWRLP